MSADKIIQKIVDKAEQDTREMRQEAEAKRQDRLRQIEVQTERELTALKEKEKASVAEVGRRSQLMTRLEIRKSELDMKRRLVEKAFEEARQALDHLDDDAYIRLIVKIVTEGVKTGDEVLLVPAAMRSRYTEAFRDGQTMMTILKSALKEAGKPDGLSLSDADAPFEGGVMLIGADSDINGSYDMLIQNVQDQYEREVYERLFEVEV